MDIKKFILPAKLKNTDNEHNWAGSSFITTDLIFIPSRAEIEGLPVYARRSRPTDYALLNNATNDTIKGDSEVVCWNFLRSCFNDTLSNTADCVNFDGDFDKAFTSADTLSIRPCMRLNLYNNELLEMFQNNKLNLQYRTGKNGYEYYTIDLGEYPQTYVGNSHNNLLETLFQRGSLQPTGKKYIGESMHFNEEYTINGEKYVRTLASLVWHNTQMSDGSKPTDSHYYWVKVEPIKWIIKNWRELPKTIIPCGYGTSMTINLQTQDSIISGIPFYPYTSDEYNYLWQNSTIRGYLNGINVNNITTNGNPKYPAPKGGDFTEHSFLTEAFDYNLILESKQESALDHIRKKRKGYGIQIEEKPMPINDQIKFYIDNGKSFMLHGPSGIGKTRRIEEIDEELVPIVLRNGILPEEVIGKTIYPNNDKTNGGIWSPPAWYVDLCEKCEREPDKQHVLFIDEITNVKPSEQSLVFHLVLNNSIGPNIGKLPNNVVVVAAGNSKEESESAYNMPEPLFRRFEGHIYLKPDIQQWIEWGSEDNPDREGTPKVHPIVSSFVGTFGKDVFYSKYDSEEPPKYAVDPRGWEQVSDIIYDNNGRIAKELIANKVGNDIATSFIAFAKNPPLMIEDILDGNYSDEDIPTKIDARYALALSLRSANMEEVPIIREFINKHLGSEIRETYDTLWIGEDNERAIYIESLDKLEEIEVEENTSPKVNSGFKITIDEFFDEKKNPISMVIHCDEEWKAELLCMVFHRMGKTWGDGVSYVEDNGWDLFGANTVYSNKCTRHSLSASELMDKTIYKFEDVDLSKHLTEDEYVMLAQKYKYYDYLPF